MRWSRLFVPTLRDAPGDAEFASHKLLVRGGFIRQLQSGHYSMLPLGFRVHEKVTQVIRDEINAIGGQEMSLPIMHPASLWQASGRWDSVGDELFRLTDRKGADQALAMTHEEAFTSVFAEVSSYKQLPMIWYHFKTKLRDELRPKAGLLRVREFVMKDSYSFDVDETGLDVQFQAHHQAYSTIFSRLGLDALPVQASSGSMGGSDSIEFVVPAVAGEDDIAICRSCDYAANIERATSQIAAVDDGAGAAETTRFPTPGVRTIAALEEVDGGAPADRQIKTLVMNLDGELTLVLVRGDHNLVEQKLIDHTGAVVAEPAEADAIRAALGASPGSLGAVGVSGLRIIADPALQGRVNMTTGANEDDWHLSGVDVDRDIAVDEWVDVRGVEAGEGCPNCGQPLELVRAIEVGHIFKLGRKYTEGFGITVLDQNGKAVVPIMGSYGIGVGRAMAAVVEVHHDDNGIVWPTVIAPFEAVITVVKVKDEPSMQLAEQLYAELQAAGIDVVLDDRDARAGVKFTDAELCGIPFRLTIGPKGLESGQLEFVTRTTGDKQDVAIADAAALIIDSVEGSR
ncbi:MAG: proline--tRNA ligase [Acidimicrobiales bacterium]|nr:proline--tRNA ligase [Acidimicrobiales bacterium]